MPEDLFNLIYSGQISPDAEINAVKNNLCQLLKVDLPKVETMFDGRTIVLKKNIDRVEAEKYKRIVDGTGAVSIIEPVDVAGLPPAGVSTQPAGDKSQVSCPSCGTRQKESAACASCGFPMKPENMSGRQSPDCKEKETFVCPKCGTEQEKGITCMRCGVIFEKLAAYAERPPADKQQINEIVTDNVQTLSTEKTVLPGTRNYLIAIIVISIVGCSFLVYSAVKLVKTAIFLNSAQSAAGTVIGFSSSRSTTSSSSSKTYAPEVDFRAPNGRLIRFTSGLSSNFVPYATGDSVPVRFDPVDPHHAEIDAFMPLWGLELIMLLFGTALCWGGWKMLGIHKQARQLNFAQYAKEKGMLSELMLCPKCGVQQPPAAICKFCQADVAAAVSSRPRWQTILIAASKKGSSANLTGKEMRIKYAMQLLPFLISASIFAWQWNSFHSNTTQKSISMMWRDSQNGIGLTMSPDWTFQTSKYAADYPMLTNQRNDHYFLIGTPKSGENVLAAFAMSGLGLDHFKTVGWDGIVAEIGRENRVKSADVVQWNGLTLYRVGYEVTGGYREDWYIEGVKELMEVCFVVPEGEDVDGRTTRVRNMLMSNLTGI